MSCLLGRALQATACRSGAAGPGCKKQALGQFSSTRVARARPPRYTVPDAARWRRPLVTAGAALVEGAVAVAGVELYVADGVSLPTTAIGYLGVHSLFGVCIFISFVDALNGLGGLAAPLFSAVVAVSECVPFIPTQPLSILAGLIFGTGPGVAIVVAGQTTAAFIAYSIARGPGRELAQRVIKAESGESGTGGLRGGVVKSVLDAIENGGIAQQFGGIVLLRVSPVVPFSAVNYLLGLTPLPLPPFLLGTAIGMVPWTLFYASIGATGRSLLDDGATWDSLVPELIERAQSSAGSAGAVVTAGAILVVVIALLTRRQRAHQPPS